MRALMATDRRFPGVYAATVTRVDDPGHRGRIMVSVPSVFGMDAPELEMWAMPCFPAAHFFVPDVGDHVWVAFENADPGAPVWLGEWYSVGSAPPEADGSPPLQRVVRTAAGHRVLLDDTAGAERVIVEDAAGSKLEMRADAVILHAAADLTIEAPGASIIIRAASVDVREG
jgi:hypothetical protein